MDLAAIAKMKHRKLRIAWSVAWGVVAVLLCVLWVRSYWKSDGFAKFAPNQVRTSLESRWALLYAFTYMLIATPDNDGAREFRNFNHKWEAVLFGPAVKIESAIRRKHIEYGWWTDPPKNTFLEQP